VRLAGKAAARAARTKSAASNSVAALPTRCLRPWLAAGGRVGCTAGSVPFRFVAPAPSAAWRIPPSILALAAAAFFAAAGSCPTPPVLVGNPASCFLPRGPRFPRCHSPRRLSARFPAPEGAAERPHESAYVECSACKVLSQVRRASSKSLHLQNARSRGGDGGSMGQASTERHSRFPRSDTSLSQHSSHSSAEDASSMKC
jgi:hypothetical protein